MDKKKRKENVYQKKILGKIQQYFQFIRFD